MYIIRPELGEHFSQKKLESEDVVLNGHVVRIDRALDYLPRLTEEQYIKLYNLLFNDEQEFANEAERFIFNNKRLWLAWCNSKKTIKVGDHVFSTRAGFGSHGGTNLIVDEINEETNQIMLRSRFIKLTTNLSEPHPPLRICNYVVALDSWFHYLYLLD